MSALSVPKSWFLPKSLSSYFPAHITSAKFVSTKMGNQGRENIN